MSVNTAAGSNVSWILHRSVEDVNWKGALDRLTDDELRHCLVHETRATGLARLRSLAKRRGLAEDNSPANNGAPVAPSAGLVLLPLDQIMASPFNPRKSFDQPSLEELAASLLAHGMLEPVAVRRTPYTDAAAPYELILGERRWRAARIAGLAEIPALVREVDDRTLLTLALEENLQRSDLNPIERAEGFRRLAELGQTQAEIAKQVGISQPRVANTLRLLRLPEDVQERIARGELSAAHGEVLLPIAETFPAAASALAAYAAEQSLPVARLEGDWTTEMRDAIVKAKAAKDVYSASFDWRTVCRACPFGAFKPHSTSAGTCLRPDHFRELEREAKAKQKAAEEAQAQKVAEQLRKKGVEVPDSVPSMNYSKMVEIATPAPSGCSESCECRGLAMAGGRVATVCNKPECYRRLAETQAKEDLARRWDQALQRIEAARSLLAQTDPAILAARVCAPYLNQPGPRHLADFLRGVGLESVSAANQYGSAYLAAVQAALKEMPAARSLEIAVEAMVWHELGQWAGWPPNNPTPLTDSIVGAPAPADQQPQQADPDAPQQQDENALTSTTGSLDHNPAREPSEPDRCCRCGTVLPADCWELDDVTEDEYLWLVDGRGHRLAPDGEAAYCAGCWAMVRRCRGCGMTEEMMEARGTWAWAEAYLCSVCAEGRVVEEAPAAAAAEESLPTVVAPDGQRVVLLSVSDPAWADEYRSAVRDLFDVVIQQNLDDYRLSVIMWTNNSRGGRVTPAEDWAQRLTQIAILEEELATRQARAERAERAAVSPRRPDDTTCPICGAPDLGKCPCEPDSVNVALKAAKGAQKSLLEVP